MIRAGTRRASDLASTAETFLSAVERWPEIRARLRRRGYREQTHQQLRACLARTVAPPDSEFRAPNRALTHSAREVAGWMLGQLQSAGSASRKLPDVAKDALDVVRGEGPTGPWKASLKLYKRVRADEHLSRFLTLRGIREAGAELRHRLETSPEGHRHRSQALVELDFLLAPWRAACLDEFRGEPEILGELGLGR